MILNYMMESRHFALITSFANDQALKEAGMGDFKKGFEYLGPKFYVDTYTKLGEWLHEPHRFLRKEPDLSASSKDLYKRFRKIEAVMWSHIIPSEDFSIWVIYGAREQTGVTVSFNDLRPISNSKIYG